MIAGGRLPYPVFDGVLGVFTGAVGVTQLPGGAAGQVQDRRHVRHRSGERDPAVAKKLWLSTGPV